MKEILMKKIPRDSKVLCLLHNDLDASVCSIILSHIFSDIKFFYLSFWKIDSVIENMNFDKYDYTFMCDIHPDDDKLVYQIPNLIMLDHHKTASTLHEPSEHRFIAENMCAAKLVYKFCSNMYPELDLSFLYSLVHITNDYDLYTLNNPKSKLMNDIMFFKYHPNKFREYFIDGRTRFTEEEIIWLRERRKEFWRLWDGLQVYEIDDVPICIVEANYFLNEIAHKLMEDEEYDLVIVRNPVSERASIRSKRDDIDTGKILKDLGFGGGHAKASGFFCKDKKDFQKKTTEILDIIKKEFY